MAEISLAPLEDVYAAHSRLPALAGLVAGRAEGGTDDWGRNGINTLKKKGSLRLQGATRQLARAPIDALGAPREEASSTYRQSLGAL